MKTLKGDLVSFVASLSVLTIVISGFCIGTVSWSKMERRAKTAFMGGWGLTLVQDGISCWLYSLYTAQCTRYLLLPYMSNTMARPGAYTIKHTITTKRNK